MAFGAAEQKGWKPPIAYVDTRVEDADETTKVREPPPTVPPALTRSSSSYNTMLSALVFVPSRYVDPLEQPPL